MKRLLAVCALIPMSLAVAGLGPVAGAAAVGPAGPVPVTPAPRIPAGAKPVGPVPGTAAVTGAVVLRPRDEAALTRFIAAVTTPGSGLFQRYLPPGAFAGAFGPPRAAVGAVRSELAAAGLRVTHVAPDDLIVDFTGSAGAAERAFHTGLERYRLADGTVGQATTSAVRMPPAVAGEVTAVVGLDNLVHVRPVPVLHGSAAGAHGHPAAKAARFTAPAGAPRACPAARAVGGLTDDQIAHAYGAFGLYGAGDLAAGQHIAVYELEPFLRSDIRTFDTGASLGTQHVYKVNSNTSISTHAVRQDPALVDVEVCSVSGCSRNPKADYFYVYPPGNPKVTSISPASGPAAGGTKVTISGQNLGCVTGVFFGTVAAEKFSDAQALRDCGSAIRVKVTTPRGKARSTVKVTVTTVESDFTGTGRSKSAASFTYKR